MMMRRIGRCLRFLAIACCGALGLATIVATGGGGGGDNGPPPPPVKETITQSVTPTGGIIRLASGFTVDFPAGAVDRTVQITVEETDLPAPLPATLTAVSAVFQISPGTLKLNRPATIAFTAGGLDPAPSEGEVGIYRWDGNAWTFVGGGWRENAVVAAVDSFSAFILGTGRSLHFPVEFDNFWVGEPVVVKVNRYILSHPDLDAPISANQSAAVFPPPNNWPKARMYLPQGAFTFCFEWDEEDPFAEEIYRVHAYHGNLPGAPSVGLDENASYVVPAYVSLDYVTKYRGRCPVPQAWVDGEVAVVDAVPADFVGTYNALDPTRTSAAYRAIFRFNADGTFTGTEWLSGVSGSFSGTWSYTPATQTISFAVPGGGAFSGQVVGSINNFLINGTWANGTPGQLQLYR